MVNFEKKHSIKHKKMSMNLIIWWALVVSSRRGVVKWGPCRCRGTLVSSLAASKQPLNLMKWNEMKWNEMKWNEFIFSLFWIGVVSAKFNQRMNLLVKKLSMCTYHRPWINAPSSSRCGSRNTGWEQLGLRLKLSPYYFYILSIAQGH